MQVHPAADAFPMLSDDELDELARDIAEHGQLEPVITWRGMLIDGRNRLAACRRAGVEPVTVSREDLDEAGVVRLIISLNVHRRHLTPSQRALVASSLANLTRGQTGDGGVTQAEVADKLGVSRRSVQTARQVQEHGVTELTTAVRDGRVAVSAASLLAELPDDQQRAALADKATLKATTARLREEARQPNLLAKADRPAPVGLIKGLEADHPINQAAPGLLASMGRLYQHAVDLDREWVRIEGILDELEGVSSVTAALGDTFRVGRSLSRPTQLARAVVRAVPLAACPDCKGAGCTLCHDEGYLLAGEEGATAGLRLLLAAGRGR